MSKINSNDVKDYFLTGGDYVIDLVRKSHGEIIDQVGEEVFLNTIEVGITNTIASLYDANIEDDEIIRVLNKFWGINKYEAEDRILFEKKEATKRELRYYLKMQGYTLGQINRIMKEASLEINHNNELWELKDRPEVLMEKLKYKD